ncbi:protein-glutamate O-methyltransferase CheR [Cohnella pontilimi]|uniref:Protein-glutamate O-methyltransferase CheR n=1 Tax=Cohnella pontilimi TaxID=2564100 RepID=A0A4V5LS86_9BACL|nr:protein-glutamate O-methyltransferase CheR [Cohnella pontilimi]TJY42139.1 protein-glutamate O-methyltransferase CheR [Cohnella pontilimi]
MKEKLSNPELDKIEVMLLLEGIYRKYGYDFRKYAYASIKRRVLHRLQMEGLPTLSALQEQVLHDPLAFQRLLEDLMIPVTEMFRDPDAFLAFRQVVVPALRELPYIRIWHAGCSTGEEVYSTAIVLHEEGLLGKARIYATDISENALERAKSGVLPIERMKQYTQNYQKAGGKASFSEYYSSESGVVLLKPELRANLVFARHNLVTDRSFNEFHVIFCRNVMIYFEWPLRDQVQKLFYESLSDGGFLVLGNKESISFTPMADRYEVWNDPNRIYRKRK